MSSNISTLSAGAAPRCTRVQLPTTPSHKGTPAESLYKRIDAAGPTRDNCGCGGFCMCATLRSDYEQRELFRAVYSYAVPTRRAIRQIAKFLDGRAVLEVGAGRALWAHLLMGEGVAVDATDNAKPTEAEYPPFVQSKSDMTYQPVRLLEAAKAAASTTAQALMLIWPPYALPMSAQALERFKGDRVVYVGEHEGGCTGTGRFHVLLDRDYRLAQTIQIPQWDGLHDEVMLYSRK